MEPRLSLVTLGVADLAVSRAFYGKLGFEESSAGNDSVAFFQAGGVVLALFGAQSLADDAGVTLAPPGFRGITLAHNVRSKDQVALVLEEAEQAGARMVKPAQDVFWGGHSGYFADPDGHLWEVAWNPFFPMDEAGQITLP
ncbi:MAG: VOC family protein [Rhodospirillaceae bacterium]|nr:VOC family protein [Rhodospirillales bacterium]